MEDILAVVHDIRSHASKRYGQGVEIDGVVVGIGEGVQEPADVLAYDEPTPNARSSGFPFFQSQAGGDCIGVVLFTLFQALVSQVILVRQHLRPFLRSHDGVETLCIISACIHATYDATHAGACDDVDGYADFL